MSRLEHGDGRNLPEGPGRERAFGGTQLEFAVLREQGDHLLGADETGPESCLAGKRAATGWCSLQYEAQAVVVAHNEVGAHKGRERGRMRIVSDHLHVSNQIDLVRLHFAAPEAQINTIARPASLNLNFSTRYADHGCPVRPVQGSLRP